LAKRENAPEVLAKTLYSLASIYFHQKDSQKALEVLGELKQLLQIINKAYLRGSMNVLYGQVYSELGDFSMSNFYYKKANFYFQVKRSWNQYGYILLGRANVLKKSGKPQEALTLYENALEFCEQGDFVRLKSIIKKEMDDLNESNVDIYLDRSNRKVYEKKLGMINFKHRFVLLEILFLLAQNPGQYYDKEVLAKEIWKEEYNPLIHDKLIYTSISRLRKLIEPKNDNGEKRKYLIRGKDGYAFNPDVKISFHMNMKKSENKMIANIEISDPV
jgi:tetratricopeptide (TPR) repeat protein